MVKLTSWLFESRAHAAYTVKDSGNFCCKVIISWGTGEMWGRKKIQYFLIWFLAPLRGLTYGRWHPPFWNSFWVLKGKAILKSEMVKGPEKLRLPGQFIMTILRLFSRLPPPKGKPLQRTRRWLSTALSLHYVTCEITSFSGSGLRRQFENLLFWLWETTVTKERETKKKLVIVIQ